MTLLEKIQKANASYRLGMPVISDEEYDALIAQLKEQDPDNEWFQKIEPVKVSEDRKVKLPIPMRSLYKVKTLEEIKEWLGKYGVREITILPKFDGCSLLVDERTGQAYSRGGDDNEGQDCTAQFKACSSQYVKFCDYSFGEFIINKENWKKHFEGQKSPKTGLPYKSSRNVVAGMLNSDTVEDNVKYAELYRYGVDGINAEVTSYYGLMLEMCSITKQPFLAVNTKAELLEEDCLCRLYNEWNKQYRIDGLVIYIDDMRLWDKIGRHESTGNPLYAMAYKTPLFNEIYETKVKAINFKVSKSGALIPVIEVAPIQLDDCVITNVSAYNTAFLTDNEIGVGAKVNVVRSGDVIPKIVGVAEKTEVKDLLKQIDSWKICPSCGSPAVKEVGSPDLVCSNPNCEGMLFAKVLYFFTSIGCKGFGEKVWKQIFDAGYKTVKDILAMPSSQLLKIEGLGTSAMGIHRGIVDRLKAGVDIFLLMQASDCFKNFGEKISRKVIGGLSDEQKTKFFDCELAKEDLQPYSSVTINSFAEGLSDFYKFLEDNKDLISIKVTVANENGVLKGKSFCFTGVRDADLEKLIMDNGGKVASGVSKKLGYLICRDINSSSSKVKKATDYGVELLEYRNARHFIQSLIDNVSES